MNLGLLGAAVVMGIAAIGSAFGIGFPSLTNTPSISMIKPKSCISLLLLFN